MGRRLTDAAHAALAPVLRTGDIALDATAGNGHDTVFLARAVGATGRVFAFDVQPEAIGATHRRLVDHALDGRTTLILDGHEHVSDHVPASMHGHVAAVTFNLGYLPGGDQRVTTRADTSIAALDAAAALLRPGGAMTVVAYRGHAGGVYEAEAVAAACERLAATGFAVGNEAAPGDGPVLWVVSAPAR